MFYKHSLNRFCKSNIVFYLKFDNVHLAQAVTSASHFTGGVKPIDIETDFE